jgi:perilipin-2
MCRTIRSEELKISLNKGSFLTFLTLKTSLFKGANSFFNWSLKKAESTASKVANVTAPVLIKLQGPIGTLDGVLCVGLDYVENKVPAVKLPPNEVRLDLDGIIVKPSE